VDILKTESIHEVKLLAAALVILRQCLLGDNKQTASLRDGVIKAFAHQVLEMVSIKLQNSLEDISEYPAENRQEVFNLMATAVYMIIWSRKQYSTLDGLVHRFDKEVRRSMKSISEQHSDLFQHMSQLAGKEISSQYFIDNSNRFWHYPDSNFDAVDAPIDESLRIKACLVTIFHKFETWKSIMRADTQIKFERFMEFEDKLPDNLFKGAKCHNLNDMMFHFDTVESGAEEEE